MTLDEVYQYITQKAHYFIEDLKILVRQPSVSAQNLGMKECSELLEKMLLDIGMQTKIFRLKIGHPIVFGQIETKNCEKTLLFYSHYDVVPPEPLEKWVCEPFNATTINDKIVGRGTADSKGNLVALIKAIESLLRSKGKLPINVKLIFEGEEEIGSPHLPQFVRDHRRLLAADAVVCYDGQLHSSNKPQLVLNLPGMLVVKLKCEGAKSSVHCGKARLVVNPAWRLLWALSSLKQENEKIDIDGFYDDVAPPSDEEVELMKRIPYIVDERTISGRGKAGCWSGPGRLRDPWT